MGSPECGEGARFQGWKEEIKKMYQLNADVFNSSMEYKTTHGSD